MTGFWYNLQYALRRQRLNPAFTALVVVTLALGIGANSAIFTVVNAVLLRPLPYADPERLVVLWETEKESGQVLSISFPNFLDWREQSAAFEDMAAFGPETLTLTGERGGDKVAGEWVSEGYFATLGIGAVEGRLFTPEELTTRGAHPVTVIGHELWQRRFGGAGVLGEKLVANGVPLTIVGVAPPGFRGFGGEAELFVPITMFEELLPHLEQYGILDGRGIRWLQAFGRLAEGQTLEGARADLQTVASRLEQEYPGADAGKGAGLDSATEQLIGDLRSSLWLLLGAVGFVLLLACVNVANLLLARGAARQREVALRLALGSGRKRLVRQLLTESALLALYGGAVGLILVRWSIDSLVAFAPVEIPTFVDVRIDFPVLAFTLGTSLFASLLFGVGPAFQIRERKLYEPLKEGNPVLGGRRLMRLRKLLVVAEVGLTLVLLVCAGLMVRSIAKVRAYETGFEAENLLTVRYDLPFEGYSEAERAGLKQQVLERLRALPTVRSGALTSHLLFGAGYLTTGVVPEGAETDPTAEPIRTQAYYVSPDYFKTLGIPLLQGRDFTTADDEDSNVVIVGAELAERLWSGREPVGERLRVGSDSESPWQTVVGVVGDVRTRIAPGESTDVPEIYLPGLYSSSWGFSLVARTDVDPLPLVPTIRRTLQEIDRDIPLFDVATLEQRMAADTSETRFFTLMMAVFAVLAVILAMVGIYGVISYSVTLRRRELGIRMALGAHAGRLLRLVVGDGMRLTLYGLALGLAVSMLATGLLSEQLFDVSATDPATFLATSLLLAAIAFAACLVPGWRAARLDPVTCLRAE